MRTLRHLGRLFRELRTLAARHRAWWALPLAIALILAGVLIVATQAGSPLIYTFF